MELNCVIFVYTLGSLDMSEGGYDPFSSKQNTTIPVPTTTIDPSNTTGSHKLEFTEEQSQALINVKKKTILGRDYRETHCLF